MSLDFRNMLENRSQKWLKVHARELMASEYDDKKDLYNSVDTYLKNKRNSEFIKE
jgi:hypothetical protein